MELNDQFVTDEKMVMVEHKPEQYYAMVKIHADKEMILKEEVKNENWKS